MCAVLCTHLRATLSTNACCFYPLQAFYRPQSGAGFPGSITGPHHEAGCVAGTNLGLSSLPLKRIVRAPLLGASEGMTYIYVKLKIRSPINIHTHAHERAPNSESALLLLGPRRVAGRICMILCCVFMDIRAYLEAFN